MAKKRVTLARSADSADLYPDSVPDAFDVQENDTQGDAHFEDKKYVAATEAMPVGTVVWYWNGSNSDPLAAIIAARADAEHCHLMVITPMGQAQDRQNVRQGNKGDKAEGEYFLAMGSAALSR